MGLFGGVCLILREQLNTSFTLSAEHAADVVLSEATLLSKLYRRSHAYEVISLNAKERINRCTMLLLYWYDGKCNTGRRASEIMPQQVAYY